MLDAARASAQKLLARDASEEERLILAYLQGVVAGGAIVYSTTAAHLMIAKVKL